MSTKERKKEIENEKGKKAKVMYQETKNGYRDHERLAGGIKLERRKTRNIDQERKRLSRKKGDLD